MESGCKRRDFGRDVQPAIPNRPRCWSLVGPTFGAISNSEASPLHGINHDSRFSLISLLDSLRSVFLGGESVCSHRTSNGLEETPPTWRKRNT